MDTTKTTTHISLCSGYGGIDLGLRRAVPDLRTVAYAEIEAFAIANLVSKMEAGLLDAAPVWPDLKTFPWEPFRVRVDILSGGYPCQPFSAAGQRKGKDDPRHLWPWIAEGIRILRPGICFFENVEGHISMGLSSVISDLEEMGYRTTWGIFSASEVGAPHQRKRVFILAVSSGFRGAAGLSGSFTRHEGQSGESDDGGGEDLGNAISQGVEGPHNNGSVSERVQSDSVKSSAWPSRPGELADSKLHGCHHADERSNADGIQGSLGQKHEHRQAVRDGQLWPSRPGEQQYGWEPPRVVADTISGWGQQAGSQCGSSEVAADSRRQESAGHQQAVIPDDQGGNGVIRQTQPSLGRNPDGSAGGVDYAELCVSCDNRTDELRLLGNGVVPATAERAFRTLIAELFPQ